MTTTKSSTTTRTRGSGQGCTKSYAPYNGSGANKIGDIGNVKHAGAAGREIGKPSAAGAHAT